MTAALVCLVRGVASVLLTLAVLALPEASLDSLLHLIGGYAILVGLAALAGGAMGRVWLVVGMLDLLLGLGVFVWPGAAALALLWPAAVTLWAVLGGATLVVAAEQIWLPTTGRRLVRANGAV
jgi:uncharacterized membrane protein HdeD (DUF308 family)